MASQFRGAQTLLEQKQHITDKTLQLYHQDKPNVCRLFTLKFKKQRTHFSAWCGDDLKIRILKLKSQLY